MAFSDCDEPSDPCRIKSKSMMRAIQVTSSFSPILLNSNNSYKLEMLKPPLNTSFDELKAMFCKYYFYFFIKEIQFFHFLVIHFNHR